MHKKINNELLYIAVYYYTCIHHSHVIYVLHDGGKMREKGFSKNIYHSEPGVYSGCLVYVHPWMLTGH